jgi:predicted nucleic acid-binding protein
MVSAISRRHAKGEINDKNLARVLAWIRGDRAYWELVEVTASVLGRAEELLQKLPLRTLDALHLASAAAFQSASGIQVRFVTADLRQADAAEHRGLDVIRVGRGF